MVSIEKIKRIAEIKDLIKQSLVNKGQNPTEEFATYAENIDNIKINLAHNAEVRRVSEFPDVASITFNEDCEFPILYIDQYFSGAQNIEWTFPNAKTLDNFFTSVGDFVFRPSGTLIFNIPNCETIKHMAKAEDKKLSYVFNTTEKLTNLDYFFNNHNYAYLKQITISDASNVKSANYAFPQIGDDFTISLPSLESAVQMFAKNTSYGNGTNPVYTINDISKVLDATQMFQSCDYVSKIVSNTTWKISKGSFMFSGCSKLTEVPNIDVSECTTMNGMFIDCTSLTSCNIINTDKFKGSMSGLFNNCTSLTHIPEGFDFSGADSIDNMFYKCTSLTYLPEINNIVCPTYSPFNYSKIIKIESLNACEEKLNYFSYINHNVSCDVRYLVFKGLGYNKVYNQQATLTGYSLWGMEDETIPLSIGARQSLIDSLLTYSYDRVANGRTSTYTIYLNAATKALLTEDEIAQITAKGYTIA